jgi:hypothetical protein
MLYPYCNSIIQLINFGHGLMKEYIYQTAMNNPCWSECLWEEGGRAFRPRRKALLPLAEAKIPPGVTL